MKIEAKLSFHNQWCIEEVVDRHVHSILRRIILNNYMDSDDYKFSTAAGAFLQGGYDEKEGWILIEFWNEDGVDDFIKYVNQQLGEV